MKLAILFTLIATIAHAEVFETTVECTRESSATCTERTATAFAKLGCKPMVESVQCRDAATDPSVDPTEIGNVKGMDFCTVQSICHVPHIGTFGQVSCGGPSVDLSSVDSGVTLDTSVGLFQRPVTTLCK